MRQRGVGGYVGGYIIHFKDIASYHTCLESELAPNEPAQGIMGLALWLEGGMRVR